MSQVNIPTDFFLNEAKREYCYLQDRLVAELFQNSVDAGAKNIHFKFDEASYTCEDDGCGMDEDRLISAMLTLGGSIKDNNSTGGFGAAKKLILFAHKSYIVVTNNIHVQGHCLSYNLTYGTNRKGTLIHAEYIHPEDFNVNSMIYSLKNVLSKCHKPNINVTINGTKFKSWVDLGKQIKSVGIGEIYKSSSKNWGDYGYINVLHNGLYMFQTFLSGVGRDYYLNVTDKQSTEVFTQNRESFRGEYSDAYSQLVMEIRTENMSFEKPKVKNFVWKGKERFHSFIFKTIQKIAPEKLPSIESLVAEITKLSDPPKQKVIDACYEVLGDKADAAKALFEEATIPADFHVDGEKTIDELKRYHPTNGLKKYKLLSAVYSNILVDLAKAFNVCEFTFALGLCFDAEGRYKKEKDGNVFLINPKCWEDCNSQKEKFYKIRSIAIHEFTHYLGFMRHDESFASKITDVTYMADIHLKGAVHYMKQATEQID